MALSAPVASANPFMQCIIENNSIGGVSSTATATNDTTSWTEAYPVPATLYWGNTSSPYPFAQSVYDGGSHFSVFLDYIEPDTVYYFEISAPKDQIGSICINAATYSGSFTTSAWPISNTHLPPEFVNGTITNSSGASPSGNTPMVITCVNPDLNGPGGPVYTYATDGYFSQLVWSVGNEPLGCIEYKDPIAVEVLNYQNPDNIQNIQFWPGQWNESIVVYAPQVVNFVLPVNFVTPPRVVIADFSNANDSNGYPNSSMSYTTGSTYTTSFGHCWQALFVFSGCSSASTETASSTSYYAVGHNLVVTQRFWESGTVLFDPYSREFTVTSEDYYAGYSPPVNEPASWPIQDTMNPSNASLYLLWSFGGQYSQGVKVYEGSQDGGEVTVSSSQTSSQVQGFDLDLGVDLEGVSVSSTVVNDQWTQTATETTTDTLSVTLYGNSQTVPICYVVYGVGGLSSAASTTADSIGVWAYSPQDSGGSYSCPLPT